MNLSRRWLSEFVNINSSNREYAQKMTMSGSKVEGYKTESDDISKVVVGKVLSVTPHPDADKLVVCKIDIGKETPLQIVTGATNVVAGALVPVATDGSCLPNGVKIKKGKLRGQLSEGMLCSVGELNLTVNDFPYATEDGIFLIEEDCLVGQDICSAIGLDDTTVEFEITSNRPDCLSVIGLARETATTYNVPLKLHTPVIKETQGDIKDYLSVEVLNPELCPRYAARVVKNVKIAPSPRWMRERLRASGVRPINNLVDITNYVMLELGHPMHAFDLSFIKDNKIIIRNAKENEPIKTLDGVLRKLSSDMLVIADSQSPSAIAGVMGGEHSSIMQDTTTVVFEGACFKGSSIRTTSKKLVLRTDSSSRFEKGLDPYSCRLAVDRACELVQLLGCGEVVGSAIDIDNSSKTPIKINLDSQWINNFLGINISEEEMIKILESLDFTVKDKIITPPDFRIDIEHKADIAEEIARIYGYDKIPSTAVTGVAQATVTKGQRFESKINTVMQALGCYEISTYSFISPKYYDNICLDIDDPLRKSVVISNPLGEETSVMRTTTLPSMLEVLAKNYNNRNAAFSAYEIGTEYLPQGENELPLENQMVTVGLYGDNTDFFKIKGIVEEMLYQLKIYDWDIRPTSDNKTFHPGRCATIFIGDTVLGVLGEVHPHVLRNYNIGVKAYLAKFDLEALFKNATSETLYKPLPKFPATTRDLSLICDEDLPIIEIEKAIKSVSGKTLETLSLFDVYKGEQISKNQKSVSYSLTLRSQSSTLTDVEADATIKRILKALEKISVKLREK
ncbi:MAG: phenylalanine--tRNA ligase subunit beta [Oscillospiraceae bacterium]